MFKRPDLNFTYWILVWLFGYWAFPRRLYCPKFALMVALFANACVLANLVSNGVSTSYILGFAAVMMTTKIAPIILLREKVVKSSDILSALALFFVYVVYFYLMEHNRISHRIREIEQFLEGKGKTPLMTFMGAA
jgi:hypothetical protein